MQTIKVSFLYENSKVCQNRVDSLKDELCILQDFVKKARKYYPYLDELDWLQIENEKFQQSLDVIYESQIWVILATPRLICQDKKLDLELIEKICKEYDRKKFRLVLPVIIREFYGWDSLPLSNFSPIDATKEINSCKAKEVCESVEPQIQLMIFEQECKKLDSKLDYSKSQEEIIDFAANFLRSVKQKISELDDRKLFPESLASEYCEKILQKIRQQKLELDERKANKQKVFKMVSRFLVWFIILECLFFFFFWVYTIFDNSQYTNPKVEPKTTIVPFTNK